MRILSLVFLVLLLAGCGSVLPFARGSGDPAEYADCLREHGVKVTDDHGAQHVEAPDPQVGEAARAACRQYAPEQEPASPEDKQRALEMGLKYAQCLRQHGVNVADPRQDSDGGITMDMPLKKDSPVLQAAESACRSQLDPGAGK